MKSIQALSWLLLGVMLLVSGALKSIDGRMPVLATAAYDIVPAWLALVIGAVLPALEVVVGAALLTGWQRRPAAALAVLLGLVFAVANGAAMARGLVVDCNCFGGLGGSSPVATFVIDLVVIALGSAAFVGSSAKR